MSQEYVDVVDTQDNAVETRTLQDCLKFGLLHRAVTIFLRNSRNEIFLQQRSKADDWMPKRWTSSCTGHVKSSESAARAAKREMREELGLQVDPVFLFKIVLPRIEDSGKTEWEVASVYEAISDDELSLDPREIERGLFFSILDCKEFFANRQGEITPDAVILFSRYLEFKKSL